MQEPEQAVIEEVVQRSRLEGVQLVGVYGAAGAIVNVRGTTRRLAQGERLEGWELLAVDATQVTFRGVGNNNDQQLTLVLERNTHE